MKQRLHADFLARAVAEITGADPKELMDTDKDGSYLDLGSAQTQLRILRARIRHAKGLDADREGVSAPVPMTCRQCGGPMESQEQCSYCGVQYTTERGDAAEQE